jgi:hypothetical protein
LDVGQLKDSLGGDLFGGTTFNPPIGSFEWPSFDPRMFIITMVSTTYCTTCTRTNNQVAIQDITISNLDVKDINLNVHIRVFKKAIKANGGIVKVDIINLFSFIFKDNISE